MLQHKHAEYHSYQPARFNNFEYCVRMLKDGISAIKHNYSNMDCKQVTLRLSKNEKSLCYKPVNQ